LEKRIPNKNNSRRPRSRRGKKNGQKKPSNDAVPGMIVDGQHKFRSFHTDKGSVELKYLNYSNPEASVTSSGSVALLNGCIQGLDSINDRIGRKIVMNSIVLQGCVQNTVTSLTNAAFFAGSDAIKIALVYDKQTNGAIPSWNDVFNVSAAFNAPFATRNIVYLDRFMILWTDIKSICATNNTIACFNVTMSFSLECRFQAGGGAGTSADFASGALYLLYADMNVSGGNDTLISFVTSITFKDA